LVMIEIYRLEKCSELTHFILVFVELLFSFIRRKKLKKISALAPDTTR